MNKHKEHNIVGEYCWTCNRPTVAGIPGWPKSSNDDGPQEADPIITSVVWADGTEDVTRECVVCKTVSCKIPVHLEEYAEIGAPDEL